MKSPFKMTRILIPLLFLTATRALNTYIVHSFTFPHIPYHRALRHIHTPEQCIEVYAVLPPGFCITQTFAPEQFSTYNAIGFRFTTTMCARTESHYAALFSSNPDCSQLLLIDSKGIPYMLVSYSVRAYFPQHVSSASFEGGHTLLVTGSYLKPPSELESIYTRRMVAKESVQNAIQAHRSACEDKNLKSYRHRVLKLS